MLPKKLEVLGFTHEVVVSNTPISGKITVKPGDEDSQNRDLFSSIIDLIVSDQELEISAKDLTLLKKALGGVIVKNAHNIDWVISSRLEKPKQNDTVPVSTRFTAIGNGIRIIKRTGI